MDFEGNVMLASGLSKAAFREAANRPVYAPPPMPLINSTVMTMEVAELIRGAGLLEEAANQRPRHRSPSCELSRLRALRPKTVYQTNERDAVGSLLSVRIVLLLS